MDPTTKKTARTKTPFDGPSQAPNGGITPDGEDDISVDLKNLEQQMQLYYEEQSEQQYDVQLKKTNKKHKGCSHRVEPITDKNKITQLYSKNGSSASFFTRVGCKPTSNTEKMMVVPYCTPTMYYVCHKFGMADQIGSKIEFHVKNDPHTDKQRLKKYVELRTKPSKVQPRFGWYKGERYLVIEEFRYGFACICGVTYESIRSMQTHFKECKHSENILPTVSSGCLDLDGIIPIRFVNDKKSDVIFNSYSCGFRRDANDGVNDLEFSYNVPSKKMLTGQCQSTNAECKQYKIINYLRQIDGILNKNWNKVVKLVNSKSKHDLYNDEVRIQWGASSIQCERIEIGVTSELVTDIDGGVLVTRGNKCWKKLEKEYGIASSWMKDIVTYAKAMAQADTTQKEFMSFEYFSLILTKSDTTQQAHIDLLHPLSQYALTISNDVDKTIAYRVKKEAGEVNSMIALCNQISLELCAPGVKTGKFNNVFRKIIGINSDSPVRQMIEIDGFGKLFQIRTTNKEEGISNRRKFDCAHIKHALTATYTRIKGGMVHCGSGVVGERVRGILFWRGKTLAIKNKYNPDLQQTMFSVMVEIVQEVWINKNHDSNLRREIVELMYLVYNLCGRNCKKNGQGYRDTKIEQIFENFNNTKPSANTICTMIDNLAAKLDLFEYK
jgi:hypothetical protein